MQWKPASAVLSALVLTACSYHFDLKVVELDGKIIFLAMDDQGTGCFSDFSVTNDAGQVMWHVEAAQYLPPPCDDKLPITYGVIPGGMTERVAAQPLRPEVLYKVEGWDGDSYSGAFRFRQERVIENIEADR